MKRIFPVPALLCFVALSPAFCVEDCPAGDACRQPAKISPFLAEVKKAEKAPELKQGKPRHPELRQGRPRRPELKPAPVETSSAPAAAAPAQAPAGRKETLSKPGWLLLMFALLAGLYYYLKEGKKRGKRL